MGNDCCTERDGRTHFDTSNSDLEVSSTFSEEAPQADFAESEEPFNSSSKAEDTSNHKEQTGLPSEVVDLLDQHYQKAGFLWMKTRATVLLACKVTSTHADEVLYHENDPILSVYVTREGRFVTASDEIVGVEGTSALGMADSLKGERFLSTVTALGESSVYEFPISSFPNSPSVLSTAIVMLENPALKSFLKNHDYFSDIQLCSFEASEYLKSRSADNVDMLIMMEGEVQEIYGASVLTISRPDWVILRPDTTPIQVLSLGPVRGCLLSAPTIENFFGRHKTQILWKSDFIRLLRAHPNFQELELENLNEIHRKSKFTQESGERVIASTTKSVGKRIFTVLQGSIRTKSGTIVAKEGEIYNLKVVSLSEYYTFKENVYAAPESVIVSTIRKDVFSFFSGSVKKEMEREAVLKEMANVQLFKRLPERQMQSIASIVISRVWKNNEVIYSQGSSMRKMYIVLAGKVLSIKDNKRDSTYIRYDYFGEQAIDLGTPAITTCVTMENVVCWEINFGRFGILFKDVQQELIRRISTKVFTLEADQLIVKFALKSPWTKKILIASPPDVSILYCILIYSADCTPDERKSIEIEGMILKQLNSPYLPYLYSEMVTPLHILLIFKYNSGMTLRGMLNSHPDELYEGLVKVYMACLLLSLNFLHTRNIVYLNLTPESVFIERSGYPKLVQFRGSQFVYDIHRPGIMITKYSAKEVVEGLPITLKSDLWSFGLIMFECLAKTNGCLPEDFSEASISATLNSPDFSTKVTSAAGDLLTFLLLSKEENINTQVVMGHDWFNSIDWVSAIQADLSEKNGHMRMYFPTETDVLWLHKGAVDPPISLSEYLQTVFNDKNQIEYK